MTQRELGSIVLTERDARVLAERDFGVKGLTAHEWVGPFVELRAIGPLIMVHDGIFDPHKGIGHHPHRYNERLFYILEGAVDHDDALNRIQGHMGTGDLGRLTEGRIGMFHKEWNNTSGRARAFILVYSTEPVPERASFALLSDADAPRDETAPGVTTKELVGARSPLQLHGDVRSFTDDVLEEGAELPATLAAGEGGLVFPLDGGAEIGETSVGPGAMVLAPPSDRPKSWTIMARSRARILRATFGAGKGLVRVYTPGRAPAISSA